MGFGISNVMLQKVEMLVAWLGTRLEYSSNQIINSKILQSYISFLLWDTRLEPKTTKTNIEVGFQQTNNQYKKKLILNNKYVTFCLCVSGQYMCPLSACFQGMTWLIWILLDINLMMHDTRKMSLSKLY
jgi:hypothetical protein